MNNFQDIHHHVNDLFDWLISGQESVDPWEEVISIPSEKIQKKRFVNSVLLT